MSSTGTNPDGSTRNRMDQLGRQVHLTGWPTPAAQEFEIKDPKRMLARKKECAKRHNNGNGFGMTLGQMTVSGFYEHPQPARLTTRGQMLTGCSAGMESGGQLNPEHSRWLMGYPAEWGSCGDTAMQSIRGRRKNSSKPLKK